jgi:hypothetical protein
MEVTQKKEFWIGVVSGMIVASIIGYYMKKAKK